MNKKIIKLILRLAKENNDFNGNYHKFYDEYYYLINNKFAYLASLQWACSVHHNQKTFLTNYIKYNFDIKEILAKFVIENYISKTSAPKIYNDKFLDTELITEYFHNEDLINFDIKWQKILMNLFK